MPCEHGPRLAARAGTASECWAARKAIGAPRITVQPFRLTCRPARAQARHREYNERAGSLTALSARRRRELARFRQAPCKHAIRHRSHDRACSAHAPPWTGARANSCGSDLWTGRLRIRGPNPPLARPGDQNARTGPCRRAPVVCLRRPSRARGPHRKQAAIDQALPHGRAQ